MKEPLITVILPVFNEKTNYLRWSIESILDQTRRDFELLIFDDGSTDDLCRKIIDGYAKKDERVRVIRNEKNIGLTKTLNNGLALARGTFIARMDSDDIAVSNRFEKQLEFMEKNPSYALCGTWAYVIDNNNKVIGKQKGPVEYKKVRKKIILINSFIHSSWFFRKSIIISLGGYSEEMKKAQDYDLLLKIAIRFPIANIPDYLCLFRMNPDTISFGDNKNQEKYALKARFKAIREYGYPKSEYLKMIRPIFFFLFIPSAVKKFLIKLLWKIS